jgi:hypothetical protein
MTELSPARKTQLIAFIRDRHLAVISTTGPQGQPQAALINIAVLPDLSLVFETTSETRKSGNIERDPRVALVVGWDSQETLQYEGLAAIPSGRRMDQARDAFIAAFPRKGPDEHWPGNNYYLVTPCWLRFSSYYRPRFVEEYRLAPQPAPVAAGWRGWLQRLSGPPSRPA